jgi:hypothetical protein
MNERTQIVSDSVQPNVRDVLEAVDEFLEQGIRSGAWEGLNGTSSNHSAIEEAAILRAQLGRIIDVTSP